MDIHRNSEGERSMDLSDFFEGLANAKQQVRVYFGGKEDYVPNGQIIRIGKDFIVLETGDGHEECCPFNSIQRIEILREK